MMYKPSLECCHHFPPFHYEDRKTTAEIIPLMYATFPMFSIINSEEGWSILTKQPLRQLPKDCVYGSSTLNATTSATLVYAILVLYNQDLKV